MIKCVHMDVEPKIGGKPPKWMVKIMENPVKMDDLGVPFFLETPIYIHSLYNCIYIYFFNVFIYSSTLGQLPLR